MTTKKSKYTLEMAAAIISYETIVGERREKKHNDEQHKQIFIMKMDLVITMIAKQLLVNNYYTFRQ